MRRFQALLIAAGLAAAPVRAAAGPSPDPGTPAQTYESFEWSTSKGRLGVMVMSLTPELRTHFGATADRGVLVASVQPGTPASTAGVAVGDVIVEVGSTPIDSATDVLSALSSTRKGQSVSVRVVRDGKPRALQATMTDEPSRLEGMQWMQKLMRPFDDNWFEQLRERMQPPKTERTTLRS
jgi:C-terminal processing protease CtpA/Prc